MEFSENALQKVREDRLLINEVDKWLFEEIEPFLGRRILEVGCGMGNFVPHMLDRELYVGTDTSATSVDHVKSTYSGNDRLDFLVADVTESHFVELQARAFDTVFSLNVFEHIRDDRVAVRNVHAVLQKDGTFILVVPAHNWLYGSIDRAIGHYRRYDKDGLVALYEENGFLCRQAKYINAAGAVGWFLNGRLFKKDTPPSSQLRHFNRFVPKLKSLESAVTVPFGISLLVVGTRQ